MHRRLFNNHSFQRHLAGKQRNDPQPQRDAISMEIRFLAWWFESMNGQAFAFEFKTGKIPGERLQFGFATAHSLHLGDDVGADHFAKRIAVQPDDQTHNGPKEYGSEDRQFPFETALT